MRKETDVALKESERRLRAIFNQTFQNMGLLSPDGRVLAVNQAALVFMGVAERDLLNTFFWEFPWWRDLPQEKQKLREAIQQASSGVFVRMETSYPNAKGDWHIFDFSIKPIVDDAGNAELLIAEARDITERKQVEMALRASEDRYRQITRGIPDLIWISDLSGRFTYVNPAVEHTHGYTVEEFLKLSFYDTVTTRQVEKNLAMVQEELAKVPTLQYDRNRFRKFESEELRKDGSTFLAEVSTVFLWSNDGKPAGVMGITHDLTERKRMEEEKIQLNAQLLQAQKMESVGRLAGGVAHDFNNMLSAILGHSELALMHCTPSDPRYDDLKAIQEAAQRSASLTRQLLTFARKQTVDPKVLDFNETITGTLKMLLRLIGEGINLVWMPGPGVWPVKMDPTQIDQILTNLCINARDAITGIGKIIIKTQNISFDEDYCAAHPDFACGDYAMLVVSDDGCGMDKETIDHVFEPFFTTKEMGRGTGLGLATVHGIVSQNEGFIDVHSEPGKGASFNIYLPRFVGETGETSEKSRVEMPKGRGEMVLLVEDEPMILAVNRTMLEKLGYTVLTADRPSEAIRKVRTHPGKIRLLITDVIMPEMNGLDLAKLLGDSNDGMKCLFASGYAADAIAHHGALDANANFIQKPFLMQDLAVKVREALG